MIGVYAIRCIVTGHSYVGGSTRVARRWREHLSKLRRGLHRCWRLQMAWDEYGEAAFNLVVLERLRSAELLQDREAHWVAATRAYPDGYNAAPFGTRRGLRLSEGRIRPFVQRTTKGRPKPPGFGAKVSAAHKGRQKTEAERRNIAAAQQARRARERQAHVHVR